MSNEDIDINEKIARAESIDEDNIKQDVKSSRVSARITDAAMEFLKIFGINNTGGNLNETILDIRQALLDAKDSKSYDKAVDFREDINAITTCMTNIIGVLNGVESKTNLKIDETINHYENLLKEKDIVINREVDNVDRLEQEANAKFLEILEKEDNQQSLIIDLNKKLEQEELERKKITLELIELQKRINNYVSMENNYKELRESYRDLETKLTEQDLKLKAHDKSKSEIELEVRKEYQDKIEKLTKYIQEDVINLVAKSKLKNLKTIEQIISE